MVTTLAFLLFLVLYIGVVIFFRMKKMWFPYFLVGAFGLTFIIIFTLVTLGLDERIGSIEIGHVNTLSHVFGVDTRVFDGTDLAVPDPTGWSILSINVECSGILESATIFSLLLFYPAFFVPKKIFLITIGMIFTYIANLARMLLIVGITTVYGKDMVYFAHAVLGRVVFFLLVVGIYWYFVTRPSLGVVYKRAQEVTHYE